MSFFVEARAISLSCGEESTRRLAVELKGAFAQKDAAPGPAPL